MCTRRVDRVIRGMRVMSRIFAQSLVDVHHCNSISCRNLSFSPVHNSVALPRICQLHQISWIRKSDLHVLTVGKHSFTSDERFRVVPGRHLDNSEDWGLQIRFTSRKDADEYICQVSGQQKQNLVVRLSVVCELAASRDALTDGVSM